MKINILIVIGVLIYVVYSIVDRFIYHFQNKIAIPIIIIGLIFILIGGFRN